MAKFLGTPPINVFEGRVSGGRLCLGDDAIFSVNGVADGEYYVGIRPEGFIQKETGAFHAKTRAVSVMGRDITVVSSHTAMCGSEVRSIISSDYMAKVGADEVCFDINPKKTFIFDKSTEMSVSFDAYGTVTA